MRSKSTHKFTHLPKYASGILLVVLGASVASAAVPSFSSVKQVEHQGSSSIANLPAGLAPALAQALQDELPASYHLAKTEAGDFQTANSAHAMQYTFGADGLQVKSTTGAWTWGLKLTRWGYVDAVQAVPVGQPVAQKTRIEYQHGPVLTEWYLNTSWGLEQGFTLLAPPATDNPGKEIVVELALSGTLQPKLAGETTLLLSNALNGQTMARYTGLYAYDAKGQTLPAKMRLSGCEPKLAESACHLQLVVDTSDAVYPLTIDPWLQQAKLTASDGEDLDYFGNSVAISGDTVVVVVYGSTYVFVKSGNWSNMTETAKLTVSNGAFGNSVAISGDTVVVGAVGTDSAYVFVKSGHWSDMTETAKLTASDGAEDDGFGNFVAISGDTVVVGAPGSDFSKSSAYVFVKSGNWSDMTETAKLTVSDWAAGDWFGPVAISGDTVVFGAYGDDDNGNNSGSAYVFVKSGHWSDMTETAKLTASDGAAGDWFGASVAISGDTVVVGAYWDDGKGSAYVFVKSGHWSDMIETAKLTASDGEYFDNFGASVAISGDTVMVGAYWDDDNGNDSGSAYVFVKSGHWSDMTETAKLTASDGAEDDGFGLSVAISGDTVVVGAPGYDDNKGSAYVFEVEDDGGNLVVLDSFNALPVENGINLDWETVAEPDSIGFFLWRAISTSSECTNNPNNYTDIARLEELGNNVFIDAMGDLTSGAVYSYVDKGSEQNMPYCYALEDINSAGESTFYLDNIVDVIRP